MSNLRTPLYDWHVAHQARMVPFAGWDMPVQYTGIVAEHRAVRSSCGIFDISHMARLHFAGPDDLQLLETVFTNSVAGMKIGQVRYGLICQEDGGILDDVLVYRTLDSFTMVVNASNRHKILNWLQKHKSEQGGTDIPVFLGHSVNIRDQTDDTAMIAIQGPKAVASVAGLFDADVSALKYYFYTLATYKGEKCTVSRTGYTGEDGLEFIVPNKLAEPLWEDLIARGAVPCGLGARDTLRLEAAMPLYGHELTESIDPIQAGLGWAVKMEKGPFIGREAILAADPNRPQRIGFEIDGKRAAREACPILSPEGAPIGTVTSGSFVPWLEKSIAMAYVDPRHVMVGTKLNVDIRGASTPATVVALPFYKRAKSL